MLEEGIVPTYQYRCTECGEELEAVQKFSDDPLTVCPACQGSLRKVFSPVGIVFKGSGFYRTDSRKGSSADGAKKDKEPAAAKSESGSADSAKSGAKESSSGSGSGSGSGASGSGSGASGSGSGASGSSGAKKEAKSSSSTSAPAATGS
jgi:putative FmdB family regulatory protein